MTPLEYVMTSILNKRNEAMAITRLSTITERERKHWAEIQRLWEKCEKALLTSK